MGFQDEPERAPLALEGSQELGAAVRRGQEGLHKPLHRRLFCGVGCFRHASFEIPAGAVRVAQARARRAAAVLGARRAQRDVTQQIRTRNKRHLIVL
jgi:hypothetical protein